MKEDIIRIIDKMIGLLPLVHAYWFKPDDFAIYRGHMVKIKSINLDGSVVVYNYPYWRPDSGNTIYDTNNLLQINAKTYPDGQLRIREVYGGAYYHSGRGIISVGPDWTDK